MAADEARSIIYIVLAAHKQADRICPGYCPVVDSWDMQWILPTTANDTPWSMPEPHKPHRRQGCDDSIREQAAFPFSTWNDYQCH